MHNCYVCSTELIWQGDHSGDDLSDQMDDDPLDNREDLIITNLSCPNCGAFHSVEWNGSIVDVLH